MIIACYIHSLISIFYCHFAGWQINFGKCANEGNKTLKLATSIGSQPDAVFVPNVGDVAVYDLQNGELVYELNGHYNAVNCCVYHPIYQVSTFVNFTDIYIYRGDSRTCTIFILVWGSIWGLRVFFS